MTMVLKPGVGFVKGHFRPVRAREAHPEARDLRVQSPDISSMIEHDAALQ